MEENVSKEFAGVEAGQAFIGKDAEILSNVNWQDIEKNQFASDECLTFTDIRRYSGSVMELKKKAE